MCQQAKDYLKHSLLIESVPLFVLAHLDCKFNLLHCVLIITFYFQVITTGNPVLDYETMPKSFDLQIFVEDTTGRTDLSKLTIQVKDKNEHPVFRGNMAIQSKIMVEFDKNNTWKDDISLKKLSSVVKVV